METTEKTILAIAFYACCGIAVVEILGYCVLAIYYAWEERKIAKKYLDD